MFPHCFPLPFQAYNIFLQSSYHCSWWAGVAVGVFSHQLFRCRRWRRSWGQVVMVQQVTVSHSSFETRRKGDSSYFYNIRWSINVMLLEVIRANTGIYFGLPIMTSNRSSPARFPLYIYRKPGSYSVYVVHSIKIKSWLEVLFFEWIFGQLICYFHFKWFPYS